MKTFLRSLSILVLAAAAAVPSYAGPCGGPAVLSDIRVTLLNPIKTSAERRREFVEISSDLADSLGIAAADIDPDAVAPNPQIRLQIDTSPALSGIENNSAVFTVVRIRPSFLYPHPRVWVYESLDVGDKNSGQFKLFAKASDILLATPDVAPEDGILDNVTLRAYRVPVSTSEFTNSAGVVTASNYYCGAAPLASQRYVEKAIRKADDQVVVIAPHGGDIEVGTSGQVDTFATAFEAPPTMTPVNQWKLEGFWGTGQTFQHWHITSTSFDVASYPGLAGLLPPAGSFDHAVAFHGFGGPTGTLACSPGPASKHYQLILGGRAPQELKCAIAGAIVDAVNMSGPVQKVAIAIRHQSADEIPIPDACGREVTQSGLSGIGPNNIVNRLAANGGVQLEQSSTLRADLADLVATATAAGLAQFLANPGAAYCAPFID
jgi:phage replication-related protein YjqB (UPF0714/DUF867 family)